MVLAAAGVLYLVGARVPRQAAGFLSTAHQSIDWQCAAPSGAESAGPRTATFVLTNDGDGPVRIFNVVSGCGCAKPQIDKQVVPADEQAHLLVSVTPIEYGGRSVAIEVQTDSLTTPSLHLTLNVKGWRRPPYLLSASGDLCFRETESGTSLPFDVTSFCLAGDETKPKISCSLPFIDVRRLSSTVKAAPAPSREVLRFDRFEARLASTVTDGSAYGQITIDDPWNNGHQLVLPVRFDIPPTVRVVPSHLVFRSSDGEAGPAAQELLIIGRTELPANITVLPDSADSPLSVSRRPQAAPTGRVARFEVKCDLRDGGKAGAHVLRVRGLPDGKERTVAVAVVQGERQP